MLDYRNYEYSIWQGDFLAGDICIDTETTLAPFHTRDHQLVTFQAYNGKEAVFVLPEDIGWFLDLHKQSIFVIQRATFDITVLIQYSNWKYWFHKIDNGLVRDTSILYTLLTLAVMGSTPDSSSLKTICDVLLNRKIEKGVERVTFGQYLGKPFSEISDAHKRYAMDDVIHTYDAYIVLLKKIKMHDTEGTLLSHDIQVKGAIGLDEIFKNGIGFDHEQKKKVLDNLDKELTILAKKLAMWGWIKGKKGNKQVVFDVIKDLGFADKLPRTAKSKELDTSKDALKSYTHFSFIKDFLRYQYLDKQGTFIRKIKDERIHPEYKTIVNTGRTSCIFENELVMCVGESKPIKDIKLGDLVYSYSDSGKLELKKVTNVWKQGVKPLLKINWSTIGDHKKGSLICTEDHYIKVRSLSNPFKKQGSKKEGWYRADTIKVGDRLFHATRREYKDSAGSPRPRIYSADLRGVQEQRIIKEQIFNCKDHKNFHIHHIDHNPSNNDLDNLELVPANKHAQKHLRDLNPLDLVNTELTYMSEENQAEVLAHAYLDSGKKLKWKDNLNYSREYKRMEIRCKRFNLDRKVIIKRHNEIINQFKNHVVSSVEFYGYGMTYDIEVEDNHNFIASEICVHNCSGKKTNSCNFQQLPKVGGIKQCFIPKPGHVFVEIDYSALELVTLAQVLTKLYGHSDLASTINSGLCPHVVTAGKIYGKNIGKGTKEEPGDVLDTERQFAKIANFGFPANMAPATFVDYCRGYGIDNMTLEESARIKEGFKAAISEMESYYYSMTGFADGTMKFWNEEKGIWDNRDTYLHTTLTGRKKARSTYTAYLNAGFQGLAADGAKLALYNIFKAGYTVVGFVHDSIVVEVPIEQAEHALKDVSEIMIDQMKVVTPDIRVGVEGKVTRVYGDKQALHKLIISRL